MCSSYLIWVLIIHEALITHHSVPLFIFLSLRYYFLWVLLYDFII
eukprot:UN00676